MGEKSTKSSASSFKIGAIALAFLVLGYQIALFVHKAAVLRVASVRDHPDTVYVFDDSLARRILDGRPPGTVTSADGGRGLVAVRKESVHSEPVKEARRQTRTVESFRFDPNTVSVEDLQRLGFSEKQALSIASYRDKGGRFRRKSDFSKSYVVSDSVYRRLEPFIDIPLLDINKADSAAFDTLPGIGAWFASKMVSYREELGGYSCKEQLMDIHRFDREKYDGLADLVCCSPPERAFALWSLPEDQLREHPYIKSWQVARSIVLFRDNTPRDQWSVDALLDAGILDSLAAARLSRCFLEQP